MQCPRRIAWTHDSAVQEIPAKKPASTEQPARIDQRLRALNGSIHDQASTIHRRRTGVRVHSRQRQRTGADFRE